MIYFRVQEFDEVTSTNDVIKQSIDIGASEGTVACAQVQTGGYGRQGRAWSSPSGGLYMSILLRPDVAPEQLPTLSLVVALAVRRSFERMLDPDVFQNVLVKWPNDVVVQLPDMADDASSGFQKICGISLEQHAGAVCVGIGINVQPPAADQLASADLPTGSKNEFAYLQNIAPAGSEVSVAEVRRAVLQNLVFAYATWVDKGFAAFVDEYNTHAALTNKDVSVVRADGTTIACGRVLRCDAEGRLIIHDDTDGHGEDIAVSSGEAHIV